VLNLIWILLEDVHQHLPCPTHALVIHVHERDHCRRKEQRENISTASFSSSLCHRELSVTVRFLEKKTATSVATLPQNCYTVEYSTSNLSTL
jgi:hypothetical protein